MEKVPEIRFAGFTDDWEQCKLSEIADKVTEKIETTNFLNHLQIQQSLESSAKRIILIEKL